jgi:citrate synthase
MKQIMDLVYDAHYKASQRENASSQAVIQAWYMNGNNLKESLVAGLMNLGGIHAPIKNTYEWLQKVYKYNVFDEQESKMFSVKCNTIIYEHIAKKKKLPGLGSSVVKGQPDPLLNDLCDALSKYNHIWGFMRGSYVVQEKDLWPNLSYYTAIACLDQNYNIDFCEEVMIRARVSGWCELLKR